MEARGGARAGAAGAALALDGSRRQSGASASQHPDWRPLLLRAHPPPLSFEPPPPSHTAGWRDCGLHALHFSCLLQCMGPNVLQVLLFGGISFKVVGQGSSAEARWHDVQQVYVLDLSTNPVWRNITVSGLRVDEALRTEYPANGIAPIPGLQSMALTIAPVSGGRITVLLLCGVLA